MPLALALLQTDEGEQMGMHVKLSCCECKLDQHQELAFLGL